MERNGPLPRASVVAVERDYLWKIKIMKHVKEAVIVWLHSGTFFTLKFVQF